MRLADRSMATAGGLLILLVLEGCGGAGAMRSAPASASMSPASRVRAESARGDSDSDGIADSADVMPQEPTAENSPSAASSAPSAGATGRTPSTATDAPHSAAMLIYTAKLTMAVYQVESALAAVEQIGRDVGGYLATRTDREIVLRVPRARFEESIKKIEGIGDVTHRDIQAQDVTDEFLDTEIRLKNARAMRDRLQALLEKAPVKEALEIEKELGRVTQEIEHMEGRLKVLRDKIAYSTVTVTFDSRAASLHTMPLRLPFGWLGELGLPHLLRLNEGGK